MQRTRGRLARATGFVAFVLLLAAAAPAQDAASTLWALVHRADAIVVGDVVPGRQAPAGMQAVQVNVIRTLHGSAPSQLTLMEPAGQSCGRALYGLTTSRHLLFLTLDASGPRLVVSDARAMVADDPTVEQHVASLLTATPQQDPALLATALGDPNPRIRRDAALALPRLPRLEQLDAQGRARLASAALTGLAHDDDTDTVDLLQAAARLRLDDVGEAATQALLTDARPELREGLLRALPRFDPATVAGAVSRHLPADPAGQHRAVALLARLPAQDARGTLERLLSSRTADVIADAGATLLQQGVVDAAWLRSRLPAAIADVAVARAAPTPPRFHSVLRGGPR